MPGGYVHLRHALPVRWLATFHHLPSALDTRRRLPIIILLWLLRIQEPDWLLQLPTQVREDAIDPNSHLRPLLLKFLLGTLLSMLPSLNPLPLPLTIALFSLPLPPLS